MPEVVDEGVTGFLVDDVAGGRGRRRPGRSSWTAPTVRRVAESRFSADRMVDDYVDVYDIPPPAPSVRACSGAIAATRC